MPDVQAALQEMELAESFTLGDLAQALKARLKPAPEPPGGVDTPVFDGGSVA